MPNLNGSWTAYRLAVKDSWAVINDSQPLDLATGGKLDFFNAGGYSNSFSSASNHDESSYESNAHHWYAIKAKRAEHGGDTSVKLLVGHIKTNQHIDVIAAVSTGCISASNPLIEATSYDLRVVGCSGSSLIQDGNTLEIQSLGNNQWRVRILNTNFDFQGAWTQSDRLDLGANNLSIRIRAIPWKFFSNATKFILMGYVNRKNSVVGDDDTDVFTAVRVSSPVPGY